MYRYVVTQRNARCPFQAVRRGRFAGRQAVWASDSLAEARRVARGLNAETRSARRMNHPDQLWLFPDWLRQQAAAIAGEVS